MADITLVCPGCHKHVSVSEYVDAAVPCPQCGRVLDKSGPRAGGDKPQLASMLNRGSLVSAATPRDVETTPELAPGSTPHERHARSRVQSAQRQWLHYACAWLVFVGLSAVFIYWQWQGQNDAGIMRYYKAARWALAGGAWLAVISAAFKDTWVQGLLNLCVPPYALYYAFSRLDHTYLRAFYGAVLVMLATEFYFLPDQTVLLTTLQVLGEWTANVRDLLGHFGHRVTEV